MTTLTVSIARQIFDVFWLVLWLTGAVAMWGHPQAWWFAYVCIVLSPLPAIYDGWRTYNSVKSKKRK